MKWRRITPYIPGIGLLSHTLKEIKKRKGRNPYYDLKEAEDRKAIRNYFIQTSYLAFAIASKFVIGAYIGTVISTGKWNPINNIKKIFTEDKSNKNKGKLEKTILYEEAIKSFENQVIKKFIAKDL